MAREPKKQVEILTHDDASRRNIATVFPALPLETYPDKAWMGEGV